MSASARMILTVLIFAVIVPGLGVLAVLGVVALIVGSSPTGLFQWHDFIVPFAAVAYGVGAVPAGAIGLAVAWRDVRGGATAGFAARGGLIGGLLFAAALFLVAYDGSPFFFILEICAVVLAVIGGLLAWRLTRWLAPRPDASAFPGAA